MRFLAPLALALAASASAQSLDVAAPVQRDTLVVVARLEDGQAVYDLQGRREDGTLVVQPGGVLMVRGEGVPQAKIMIRSGFSDGQDVAVASPRKGPGTLRISSAPASAERYTDLWVFACAQESRRGTCQSWQRAVPRTTAAGERPDTRIQIGTVLEVQRAPDPPVREIDPH